MDVSELMKVGPRMLEPDDPLDVAESVLRATHARQWPVVQHRALVGIVSLRDLLTAYLPISQDGRRAAHRLRVGHFMTHALVVAHPADDVTRAAMYVTHSRLSCLPVVDGEELVGVVTRNDLMEHALAYLEEHDRSGFATPVARLMTRTPLATADALDNVDEADALMRHYGVRHLPVTSGGRLVGILSDRDILESWWARPETGAAMLVGEAMTPMVETTSPGSEATTAGHVLLAESIGAMPVLRQGELVGILSKGDYLRYFISMETCEAGNQEAAPWTTN
jgi:CBS domain-containing protein